MVKGINQLDISKSIRNESKDEEIYFESELFLCEDYEERIFHFQDMSQSIFCSTAASTDHDLTGQIVWPVSVFLSWFISNNKNIFKNKIVLELGAGCGLAGFVVNQITKKTILTDGSDVVLRLLRKNLHSDKSCFIEKLIWGDEESIKHLFSKMDESIDILIGADVICWPNLIDPLLMTVKSIFLSRKTIHEAYKCRFYCGFVCRALSTKTLLFEKAKTFGLQIDTIYPETFLPVPIPENVKSCLNLELLTFKLDGSLDNALNPVNFITDNLTNPSAY